MEAISGNAKYFLTPTNNVVRGVLQDGKITGAELFVNKKNEYSTPAQLNQLMKERNSLAQGKVDLKEIKRPNYAEYNIPVDAGRKRSTHKVKAVAGATEELEAGKRRSKSRSRKSVSGGNIEVDAGRRRKTRKSVSAGNAETEVDAGRRRKQSKAVSGGAVEDTELEAGKRRRKSKRSDPMSAGKSTKSKKSSKSKKSKKSKGKRSDDSAIVLAGAPTVDEKKTTLADLFKQVSLHLANQTSELIAKGGNPTELLKSDIKFFSKQ